MNEPIQVRYDRKGEYLHMAQANPDDGAVMPPQYEIIAELAGGFLCVLAMFDGKKMPINQYLTFVRSDIVNKTVSKL
jgi:hypothetical protein